MQSPPKTTGRTTDRKPPSPSTEANGTASSVDEKFSILTQQFEALKAQVRQAQQLASLGTAAAMIAHETNNLLTPMLSYADYALNARDPQLMEKALTIALKNARILVSMSERLLEISSASPPKRGDVLVRIVADDALAGLCREPAKDGITLTVNIPEGLMVYADALQLQQVLFNLLLNAREAMAPQHKGRLTISAEKLSQDRVAIHVHNTGAPIPPELLPHVFEALQTSKPADRNGRRRCGGLGLALCRDLVEENGGTITAESSPERGTTFTIVLGASG